MEGKKLFTEAMKNRSKSCQPVAQIIRDIEEKEGSKPEIEKNILIDYCNKDKKNE